MRSRVLKFGGTSLGSPERVRAAVAILREAAGRGPVVAVASAFAGVTDQLFELCERARERDGRVRTALAALVERHRTALLALAPDDREAVAAVEEELDRLAEALEGCALLRALPEAARDLVVSAGERLAVAILAGALRAGGLPGAAHDAADLVATDASFGEAEVDLGVTRRRTRTRLLPRLAGELPVVPGFYGAGPDGGVRLLGRGASDLTATLLGAALGAEAVEIWTDVDGVLSADPRLVPEAFTLPLLSPEMVGELAFFGAKVLHPRATQPAAAARIPIVVANSLSPGAPRTEIAVGAPDDGIRALASLGGVGRLRVVGAGPVGPALAGRVAAVLAAARVHVLLLQQTTARAAVTVVIPWTDAERSRVALAAAGLEADARNGLGLLTIFGEEVGGQARQVLSGEGIRPLVWSETERGGAVALVEEGDLARVASRLHAEVVAVRSAQQAAA